MSERTKEGVQAGCKECLVECPPGSRTMMGRILLLMLIVLEAARVAKGKERHHPKSVSAAASKTQPTILFLLFTFPFNSSLIMTCCPTHTSMPLGLALAPKESSKLRCMYCR